MSISAVERVRRFYTCFCKSDRVLIVINADPDAIASAMAVKRLLWRKVTAVTISVINVIERPDNLEMIRLLSVKLTFIKNVDLKEFNRFVIVDSQPDHHECFAMFRPHVIIDHHPETCPIASYVDIRPHYGATATILTEYIRALKIKPSVKLATALFLAIKTDTRNFERQTQIEDIRAFQFLYRHVNIHLTQRIEQTEIQPEYLKYYLKALHNKVIKRGRVFIHLGRVTNPDICVLIADFFMHVSSITWSIVSGIYDKKLVIIFRNDGLNKNAGKTAQTAFGRFGSAGGHKSMARAEIDIKEIGQELNCRTDKALQDWIIKKIYQPSPLPKT